MFFLISTSSISHFCHRLNDSVSLSLSLFCTPICAKKTKRNTRKNFSSKGHVSRKYRIFLKAREIVYSSLPKKYSLCDIVKKKGKMFDETVSYYIEKIKFPFLVYPSFPPLDVPVSFSLYQYQPLCTQNAIAIDYIW